jgi:UDP-2,4-diacetamido-2,4,6-trideoxy-beta-L-altropyranose hydrolase
MSVDDLLIVRVDASAEIGTGHAMRCLALSQGWKDARGRVAFVSAEILPVIGERLEKEGIETIPLEAEPGSRADAAKTVAIARERGAAWVAVDGYRFNGAYQQTIRAGGSRLLAFDDYGHAGDYFADLVLNQNASAAESLYEHRMAHSRLLLGPRYVVLQRVFRTRKPRERPPPAEACGILVTMGGVDSKNATLWVLRGLEQAGIKEAQVRLLASRSNPHLTAIEAAAKASPLEVCVEHDPPDMAEIMAWADLAIAAAGTTSLELAYLGVPSLLVAVADNQRAVAQGLDRAGAARSLGRYEDLTEEKLAKAVRDLAESPTARAEMSARARALVDGQGVLRVVTEMKAQLIDLRPVRLEDARTLFDWANDREVRSVSFRPDTIPWEEHLSWLAAKRNDPTCRFYLGSDHGGVPLGQIRFDASGEEAEVSVSLDARFRGLGYGSALILAGSRRVFADSRVRRLYAYVKEDNEPSVRAFLKAGYGHPEHVTVHGIKARRLVLEREAL